MNMNRTLAQYIKQNPLIFTCIHTQREHLKIPNNSRYKTQKYYVKNPLKMTQLPQKYKRVLKNSLKYQ